ncbi:MAG TPA: HNH endonuclease [Candidatus Competibacter phosphatis]|nr:HNH endonuclease [Candidatus Competibacter phosphatis]
MPTKAKRGCSYPGCPALVSSGSRCPAHQRHADQQRNQQIDANRGTSTQRGYDARWRRIRLMYLRAHPLCVECAAHGRTTQATEVDHITPLANGGTHAEENLQALCKSCHSRKTAAQSLGWRKVGRVEDLPP